MSEIFTSLETAFQAVRLAWDNKEWEWLIAWIAVGFASVKVAVSSTKFTAPKVNSLYWKLHSFVFPPPKPIPPPSELCETIISLLHNSESEWSEKEKLLICGGLEARWTSSECAVEVTLGGMSPMDYLIPEDEQRVKEVLVETLTYHRKKNRSSNINKMIDAAIMRGRSKEAAAVLALTDDARKSRGA